MNQNQKTSDDSSYDFQTEERNNLNTKQGVKNVIQKKISKSVIFNERSQNLKRKTSFDSQKSSEFQYMTDDSFNQQISDSKSYNSKASSLSVTSKASFMESSMKTASLKGQAGKTHNNGKSKSDKVSLLRQFTNLDLRKQLNKDIRTRTGTSDNAWWRSSTRALKTARHQFSHYLGERAALEALMFDEYFAKKNIEVTELPSFEELLKMLPDKEREMSFESTKEADVKSIALKKSSTYRTLMVMKKFYKECTKDLKNVEKFAWKIFSFLTSQLMEEEFDGYPTQEKKGHTSSVRNLLTPATVPDKVSKIFGHEVKRLSRSRSRCYSLFSNFDNEPSSTMGAYDDDMYDEEDEERLQEELEEKHRNSQKALLSLFALELLPAEVSEFQHLLDRFWNVYESRSVFFNQSEFSSTTRARMNVFAKKVLDAAVRKLKQKERNRKKYTEFLFPELKAKKVEEKSSLHRRVSTFVSNLNEPVRTWEYTPPRQDESERDATILLEKVKQLEDERRQRTMTPTFRDTTFHISSEKTNNDLYEYAEKEFEKMHLHPRSSRKIFNKASEEKQKRVEVQRKEEEKRFEVQRTMTPVLVEFPIRRQTDT